MKRHQLRLRAGKLAHLVVAPAHWRSVRHGVVPSVEHTVVPFRDVKTVLDVGASRGQFARFALHRFPQARVISFEPLPEPRAVLERSAGDGRHVVHATALGSEPGEATIHVSNRDDSSSLLPIGERQIEEFPGTEEATSLTVPVGVLADFLTEDLQRPVLLKMDVQGFELDALRGAGDRLSVVDQIFVECSFVELYQGQPLADEVICFLRDAGFRLAGVYGEARADDGTSLQADFLFERR